MTTLAWAGRPAVAERVRLAARYAWRVRPAAKGAAGADALGRRRS
jgi:hypothetical protein